MQGDEVVSKNMSKPQLLAWGIFILENLIIIASSMSNLLHPLDPSGRPNTPLKFTIWCFVIFGIIVFQIINGIVISQLDNPKQGWLVALAILSLLHDPLYLIPVLWKFLTSNKYNEKKTNSN